MMSKVDLLHPGKYTVLYACACTFQPGNFTGWGSEGVVVVLPNETGGGEWGGGERAKGRGA